MSVALGAHERISRVFEERRGHGCAAFIPFLMAGDPSSSASVELVTAAAAGGADIIEIGIPYSDPLADGPTIQRAAQRALSSGTDFSNALEITRRASERLPGTPLIGFTYYNPVLVRGLAMTARDFDEAGLSGIVVPDLPLVEAAPLVEAFADRGLAVTLLVAPTTPDERAASIANLCTGFVYVVSRMGVTGAHEWRGEQLRDQVTRLRNITSKPIAVGFGVTSAASAAELSSFADGVIVGSALIDRITGIETSIDAVESVRTFCTELAHGCCGEHVSR